MWEEGAGGERRGGVPFTTSLESFPIKTPTNGAHDASSSYRSNSGEGFFQVLSDDLGKSSFIVYDAADLDSAVEGPGDAISLTNARY